MKKINNKGLTLIELIVSFAIVSVAIIYFYQTISTVSKLYATSRDDTNEYANSTYVLRLVDAYCNQSSNKFICGDDINKAKKFCKKLNNECNITDGGSVDLNNYSYTKLLIELNDKKYNYLARKTPIMTYVITYNYNGKAKVVTYTSDNNNKYYKPTNNVSYEVVKTNNSANEKGTIYKVSLEKWIDQYGNTYNFNDNIIFDINDFDENNYKKSITLRSTVSKTSIFEYDGSYEVIDDNDNNWRIKFKTSGMLKLKDNIEIDAFAVGGGGGGGTGYLSYMTGGGGGGGGYTSTINNVTLSNGVNYDIVIGNGGNSGQDGEKSYIKNGSNYIINVAGGKAGMMINLTTYGVGGAGGSGGGAGGYSSDYKGGKGGQFGNAGEKRKNDNDTPGAGSGKTTCEFGLGTTSGCNSGVTNYASGGSGGAGRSFAGTYGPEIASIGSGAGAGGSNGNPGKDATANTGSGGGGGSYTINPSSANNGGSGGSGIIIIRNKRSN